MEEKKEKSKGMSASAKKTEERRGQNLHPHNISVKAVAPDDEQYQLWKNVLRIWHHTMTSMIADLYWGYILAGRPRLVDLSELEEKREQAERAKAEIVRSKREFNEAKKIAKEKGEKPPKRPRDKHPIYKVNRTIEPHMVREIFYSAFGQSTSVGIKNPTRYYECRQRFFLYWKKFASVLPPEVRFPRELGPWIYDGLAAKVRAILDAPDPVGATTTRLYRMLQGDAKCPMFLNFGIPFLFTESREDKRASIHYPFRPGQQPRGEDEPELDDQNKNITMHFQLNHDTTLNLVLYGKWSKRGKEMDIGLEGYQRWLLRAFAAGYDNYKFYTPWVNMRENKGLMVFIPYSSPGRQINVGLDRHMSVTVNPQKLLIGPKNAKYKRACAMILAVDNDRKVIKDKEKWRIRTFPCQNVLDKLNGFSAVAVRRAKALSEAKGYRGGRWRKRVAYWLKCQSRTTEARSRFVDEVNKVWVDKILYCAEQWKCGKIVLAMPSNLANAEAEESDDSTGQKEERVRSVEEKTDQWLKARSQGRLFSFPWQWGHFKRHLEAKAKERGVAFELRVGGDEALNEDGFASACESLLAVDGESYPKRPEDVEKAAEKPDTEAAD